MHAWGKYSKFRALVLGLSCFAMCTTFTLSVLAIGVSVVASIDTPWHLGGGATVSPDGHSIVYVSADGLHLHDVIANKDRVLVPDIVSSGSVFENPQFTPDGSHVLFSVSGGTWHYPSDIYSIRLDGTGASKLTEPVPASAANPESAAYKQYFYSAMISPKSSDILLWVYDASGEKSYVGIMKNRTVDRTHNFLEKIELLAEGEPIAWSDDGSAFYYVNGDKVTTCDVATRQKKAWTTSEKVLGIAGPRTLAMDDGKNVHFVDLRSGDNLPPSQLLPRMVASPQGNLTVSNVQWIPTGLTLIVYRGPRTERIELVNIGDDLDWSEKSDANGWVPKN